jgi:hypothetical protein
VHSIRHFDKLHNHSDSVVAPVLLRRNHTTPTSSLHQLRKHLVNSFEDHFLPLGWTRSPSLGHPMCHHLAGYVVFTRLPRTSSPLGRPARHHRLDTSSPLGRPARRHSVGHVLITRPLRASPLGCARLHHSAAPRVATRLCTSTPLDRSARRHSAVHILAPRPPRASLSVGHVSITTSPTRE